ncbi:hypothetical protein SDC9_14768 [bioreactor metagenome]|uniref:Flp/Fap pilin component n=1 Tax=bioreactor metagenome TaxID=1076179 RepID=A0A644TPW5_9ZZZZ
MKKTVKMMLWYENFKASLRNEKGQGMVEYGLILALIAVAVVGTLGVMGDDISAKFTSISTELTKP